MGRRLNQPSATEEAKLSLRVDFAEGRRLGPGKVLLLEAITTHGSISAAARAIGMSYKRAWDLIEELNVMFGTHVVESRSGGAQGGGAALTTRGAEITKIYREMEALAAAATAASMAKLMKQRK